MIYGFMATNQLTAPAAQLDPADVPDVNAACTSMITSRNLTDQGITFIIWTTGFSTDFSCVNLPILDSDGNPKHGQGIWNVDGL